MNASGIVLAFLLTQVVPAWALQPKLAQEQLRVRAPEEGTPARAGLEAALASKAFVTTAVVSPGGVPGLSPNASLPAWLSRVLSQPPEPPRPISDRIVLIPGHGEILPVENDGDLPVRSGQLIRRLAQAVADGSLSLTEAADPLLALTFLAPKDRRLLSKAGKAIAQWKDLCPNCGDHVLHEVLAARESSVSGHSMLHIISGVATALDLYLLKGELRSIRQVDGVDHGQELGRTAQTVRWLLEGIEGGEVSVGEGGASLENLGRLASAVETAPVVAIVSHQRTPGREADHYVRILHVDPAEDVIIYEDVGDRKVVSLSDFIALHSPDSEKMLFFFNQRQREQFADSKGDFQEISGRQLTDYCAACGVILHVGRYSQEGGLAAALIAAYRGKDNTGEIVVEPSGVRRVTVQGSPSALVREFHLMGQGHLEEAMVWYQEANPKEKIDDDLERALESFRDDQPLTEHQRYLIHNKWRSLSKAESKRIQDFVGRKALEVLREQGLSGVSLELLQVPDGDTGRMRFAIKDDLYRILFYESGDEAVKTGGKQPGWVSMHNVVGFGKQGSAWSGRWIKPRALKQPESASWDEYQTRLAKLVDQIQALYRYDLNAIREILRFELVDIMERIEEVDVGRATRLEASFVRLFEQVLADAPIKDEDQTDWREIWGLLASEYVRVAGHVSSDPVRHVFRLQGRLISAIRHRSDWSSRIQGFFIDEMPDDKKGRNWYQDWRVESATNTPGRAFAAITEWFQRTWMTGDMISKYGIEMGQLDAFTLAHLHVVDRILRHDRWATTGSRSSKDAQPITDTGLLSGLDDKALLEVIDIAKRRYGREARRAVRRTEVLTPEDEMHLLNREFLRVLRDYIEIHPEHKGQPARGYAHNGDLSPVVQNDILPLLVDAGYFNEQVRADAATGQVRTEQILTDTWKLVALQEYVYDQWRKDMAFGLISGTTAGGQYSDLEGVGFMPLAYRKLWNEIVTNLQAERLAVRADDIARRIALLEFAEGILISPGEAASEIAMSGISMYDLGYDGVVSHRRGIEIVMTREADGNIQVQYTSDALTALSMFDPGQVQGAIQEDTDISAQYHQAIYELIRRSNLPLSDPNFLTEAQLQEEKESLVTQTNAQEAALGEPFRAEMSVTLKGPQKYVQMRREWDTDNNRFDVELIVTNFRGQKLATIRTGEEPDYNDDSEVHNIKVHTQRPITLATASKGGYRTFGLKEIMSELGALIQMRVFSGVRKGEPKSLDITREGITRRTQELTDRYAPTDGDAAAGLETAGLDREKVTAVLKEAIETGEGTNINTGVGSSENDSTAARAMYRHLLPFMGYDTTTPARLISTAAHYDAKSTLATGDSWSGTTALTLLALQWLKSQGVSVAGITGNPTVKDLHDIVGNSAGTVHARTKKEVAIYTTVGFLMILEGAFEEAIQQNIIAQEIAERKGDEPLRQELQNRLEAVYDDYHDMVDHVAWILRDPNRDFNDENSTLSKAARHMRKVIGMQFIGDYHDNPILDEIGIKVGETRNINFTSYDFKSHRYEAVVKHSPDHNLGWFLNVTSLKRLKEATETLKKAREYKMNVLVQTFQRDQTFTDEQVEQGYDKDWEAFLEELDRLEVDFDGEEDRPLVSRIEVPRVHFTLQPMADVITGQIFGVLLALEAGYSNEATDGPRNLAKAVTVLGVQLALSVGMMTVNRFLEAEAQGASALSAEMQTYRSQLAARWDQLDSPAQQGVHRLPLRMDETLEELRLGESFGLDEDALKDDFGPMLDGLKRIVVLFDTDEAAQIAGLMAAIPLANSETVLSDSQDEKLFGKAQDNKGNYRTNQIRRALNGRVAVLKFERTKTDQQAANRITIQFEDEKEPAIVFSGDERGILQALSSQPDVNYDLETGTIRLAGRTYVLKVLEGRGISLKATAADLLGVPVVLHRPTDFTLGDDVDEGTLVIAISRSNHRGPDESRSQVAIDSALEGRDAAQKDAVSSPGESDEALINTLGQLTEAEAHIFTVGDENSTVHDFNTHGYALLNSWDLDVHTAVPVYYATLLLLGSQLGALRAVPDAGSFEQSLVAVPNILARTLNSLYTEEVETGQRLFWPNVASVTLPVGRGAYAFAFTPDVQADGRVEQGVVTVSRRDLDGQLHPVLRLDVTVDRRGKVTRLLNPQEVYTIDERAYHITLDPAQGIVLTGTSPDFEGGGSLRRALVSLRQNKFGPSKNRGRQVRSWGVIGGVQDRAGAAAVVMSLEQNGYQARHLEVDESVHGWYALINDVLEKMADLFFREGVNPDFDPDSREEGQLENKDVGIIILATDSRTFGASIIDAQRARTRNARIILVVKESDRNTPAVVNAGAHLVLTVPDAFNEMSSFSHELLGQVIAQELARSEASEYAYNEDSEWARLARLPAVELKDVTMAQEISAIVQDSLETDLEERGRTPVQVNELVSIYNAHHFGDESLLVRQTPDNGRHAVYAIFPYREPVDVTNPSVGIRDALQEIEGLSAPHDLFVTSFNAGDGSDEVALVRLEFNRSADAVIVAGVMNQVVEPYNAAAIEPAVAQPLPLGEAITTEEGEVFGVVWSEDNPSVVVTGAGVAAQLQPLLLAGAGARAMAVGARGSAPLPEGVHSLQDPKMQPGQPARKNLDALATHTRTVYATRALDRASSLVVSPAGGVVVQQRETRTRLITLSDGRVMWILVGEGVKALVTDDYGREQQLEGEPGAASVGLVFADADASRWALPDELEGHYARQVAVHIPVEAQPAAVLGMELRAALNPMPSVELDETGTSALERQLDIYARANDLLNVEQNPDLSRVRVFPLRDRPRDEKYWNELKRLQGKRDLIIADIQDGTIGTGMSAALPPSRTGGILNVSFTSSHATQAHMLGVAIGMGLFPSGTVAGWTFMPDTVNDPEVIDSGRDTQEPIAGATDWHQQDETSFREWLPSHVDSLINGGYLTHQDVAEESFINGSEVFVYIPITDDRSRLGDPIPGTHGLPGVTFIGENAEQIGYSAVVAQQGSLFVRRRVMDARMDRPVPVFLPDPSLQVTSGAQIRSVRAQVTAWFSNWAEHLRDGGTVVNAGRLGDLVNAIVKAFGQYLDSVEIPQVIVMPHPIEENQTLSFVVTINPNRKYLVEDVMAPVRRAGASFASDTPTNLQFYGSVITFLDVEGVSLDQMEERQVAKMLTDRLRFTTAFLNVAKDPSMERYSPAVVRIFHHVHDQSTNLGRGQTIVQAGDYPSAPHRGNAFLMVSVPAEPKSEQLDTQIRQALEGDDESQKVALVEGRAHTDVTLPLALAHTGEDRADSVRHISYVLDGTREEKKVVAAVDRVNAAVKTLLEASVEAPPRNRDEMVRSLEAQFRADGGIHFDTEYNSSTHTTEIIIIGPIKQPNLIGAVSGPVGEAGITFTEDHGVIEDDADISYFVAEGVVPERALTSIQGRIDATIPLVFAEAVRSANESVTIGNDQIAEIHAGFRIAQGQRGFDVTAEPREEEGKTNHTLVTVAVHARLNLGAHPRRLADGALVGDAQPEGDILTYAQDDVDLFQYIVPQLPDSDAVLDAARAIEEGLTRPAAEVLEAAIARAGQLALAEGRLEELHQLLLHVFSEGNRTVSVPDPADTVRRSLVAVGVRVPTVDLERGVRMSQWFDETVAAASDVSASETVSVQLAGVQLNLAILTEPTGNDSVAQLSRDLENGVGQFALSHGVADVDSFMHDLHRRIAQIADGMYQVLAPWEAPLTQHLEGLGLDHTQIASLIVIYERAMTAAKDDIEGQDGEARGLTDPGYTDQVLDVAVVPASPDQVETLRTELTDWQTRLRDVHGIQSSPLVIFGFQAPDHPPVALVIVQFGQRDHDVNRLDRKFEEIIAPYLRPGGTQAGLEEVSRDVRVKGEAGLLTAQAIERALGHFWGETQIPLIFEIKIKGGGRFLYGDVREERIDLLTDLRLMQMFNNPGENDVVIITARADLPERLLEEAIQLVEERIKEVIYWSYDAEVKGRDDDAIDQGADAQRAASREFRSALNEFSQKVSQARESAAGMEQPPTVTFATERISRTEAFGTVLPKFRQQLQGVRVPFDSAAIQQGTGVVVDVSAAGLEAQAAVLSVVPEGTAVLFSSLDDLLKIEQWTGVTALGRKLNAFFVKEEGGFARTLNQAIGAFRGVRSVFVYSTRSQAEVDTVTAVGGRPFSVRAIGDLTLQQILRNLGAVGAEAARAIRRLMEILEGAKGLVQFM